MQHIKSSWLVLAAAISTTAMVGCSSTGSNDNANSDYESTNMQPETEPMDVSEKTPKPNPALAAFPIDTTVRFAFDSDALTGDTRQELKELVQASKKYDDVTLRAQVDGFTDATGPDEYNDMLSDKRANSVTDYLKSEGVRVKSWSVDGHGESNPVADNDTSNGRELNRRVMVKFSLEQDDSANLSAR